MRAIVTLGCFFLGPVLAFATDPEPAPDGAVWSRSFLAADRFYREGKLAEAEAALRQIVSLAERFGLQDERAAMSLTALGNVQQDRGECAAARASFWRALQIWDAQPEPHGVHAARTAVLLVGLYLECGGLDRAEALLHARRKQLEAASADPLVAATLVNARAVIALLHHRYGKAEDLFRRAEELLMRQNPPDRMRMALAASNLSTVLISRGRPEEALPYAERALRSLEGLLGPDNSRVGKAWNNVACVYVQLGRYDEAVTGFRRALDIATQAFGPGHAITAGIMTSYAVALDRAGRKAEAVQVARDARSRALQAERSSARQTVDVRELAVLGGR